MVIGAMPAGFDGLINRRKKRTNVINFYGSNSTENVLVVADVLSLAGSVCIVDCTPERNFTLTYFDSSSKFKSIQLQNITICEESAFKGEKYYASVVYVNGYLPIKRESSTVNYVMCEVDMSSARRCSMLMNEINQDFVLVFKRDIGDDKAVDLMLSVMDSEHGFKIKQMYRIPLSADEMQCAIRMKMYGVIEYWRMTRESLKVLRELCVRVGISEVAFMRYVRSNQ